MLGVFGKFTLLDKIAEGGMAEVFRASVRDQAGQERVVAIKRLHKSLCNDGELIDMLADEARLTVQLEHPSIGRVFDLGVIDQQSFLIMEFIDGPDLQFLQEKFALQGQAFPVLEALYTMSHTLAALHYAHTRRTDIGEAMNIVHRDISPQNIMIDVNGVVRIVDFGIAKAKNRLIQTQHGIIKGKYFYMAPEQAMGHHVDGRADVFSVGMVLYELLAGQSPYEDLPDVQLLKTVRQADFPPLSRYCPHMDPEIVSVIEMATARDVDRRFSSALEFKQAIDRILKRLCGRVSPDLSVMVRHFVAPTLEVSSKLKRESYQTSDESVIFHLNESELIDVRVVEPESTFSLDRDRIDRQFSVQKASPRTEKPKQKMRKNESQKLEKSQSKLIFLLLAAAAIITCIAIAVLYLKKENNEPTELAEVTEAESIDDPAKDANTKAVEEPDMETPGTTAADPTTIAEPVITTTQVAFTSAPINASVLINGEESGTTPLSVKLNVGESYTLSLKKDGFETFEKELVITNDMEINEKLIETRRVVSLMSYPSNATIIVDGKTEGQTPIMLSGFDEETDIEIIAESGSSTKNAIIRWKKGETAVKEIMFEFQKNKGAKSTEVSLMPLEKAGDEKIDEGWDAKKKKAKTVAAKPPKKVVKKRKPKKRKKVVKKKKKADDTFDPWGTSKKKKKKKVDDDW